MTTEICSKTGRTIELGRAGGHVTARYKGRKPRVFGSDQHEAVSRLKAWDKSERIVEPTGLSRLLMEAVS